LLWGLGEKGKTRTLFSDRFQLGGPTSVRSFRTNSLGPRDGGKLFCFFSFAFHLKTLTLADDSIGGQLYYSAGISAISDMPGKPQWPVKLHAWVNAGRLDGVNQGTVFALFALLGEFHSYHVTDDPIRATVLSSLSSPSISVGLGLLYRFDPVRIEMNFGVPVVASKSDGMKRGMQVGIGLEFL